MSRSGSAAKATGGVFYLYGDDDFSKSRRADEIVRAHLDPATRDFNLDLLRGSEVDLETLASVIGTPPMMAEWRVVLVREAEGLASSPKAREVLVNVAKSPPPGLCLVLVARVPSRSKARFYSDLAKYAQAQQFRAVRPEDAPGWLMDWTRQAYGKDMDVAAATALVSGIGTDLGVLDQEAAKLAEFVGDESTITVESVRAAGTHIPRQDLWAWYDLVGSRRFREAMAGLPALLDQGESGVRLVIGLGGHLLRLAVMVAGGRRALEAALSPQQRWLLRGGKLDAQARAWSLDELNSALLGLRRADRLLKASSFGAEHLIEEWLLARIQERERAA